MILYFDTETSGLHPGEICQLSYIVEDKNSIRAENLFFKVNSVEYSAYLVHGFSVEKLAVLSGGKTFKDHIEKIEADFCGADLVVAHNFSFDSAFMRKEFERAGKSFCVKKEFCSMKKATPICKLCRTSSPGYKYPKLSEFCAHFGVDDEYVNVVCQKLFGEEKSLHDARFDTTAMFLAVRSARNNCEEFATLKEFL